VVFLALIESFGQNLNLKSKLTAEGDLVIYGCDESGKQMFSYIMKNQNPESLGNQDMDEDAEFGNFDDEL
jgi:hypothetical protein